MAFDLILQVFFIVFFFVDIVKDKEIKTDEEKATEVPPEQVEETTKVEIVVGEEEAAKVLEVVAKEVSSHSDEKEGVVEAESELKPIEIKQKDVLMDVVSSTIKQVKSAEDLLKSSSSDSEDNLIEIEDPDDYLLYLEGTLKKVHKRFYEAYNENEEVNSKLEETNVLTKFSPADSRSERVDTKNTQ